MEFESVKLHDGFQLLSRESSLLFCPEPNGQKFVTWNQQHRRHPGLPGGKVRQPKLLRMIKWYSLAIVQISVVAFSKVRSSWVLVEMDWDCVLNILKAFKLVATLQTTLYTEVCFVHVSVFRNKLTWKQILEPLAHAYCPSLILTKTYTLFEIY